MKGKVLAIILTASMVLGMTACGASSDSASSGGANSGESSDGASGDEASSEQSSYKLAIISKGMTNSWYQVVYNGVKDTTDAINKEAGYEKISTSFIGPDTQSDVAVQVAAIEAGTQYGAINQAPYDIGKTTVETMLKVAEGESDLEDIDTAYTFYNVENLNDEEVQQNMYQ